MKIKYFNIIMESLENGNKLAITNSLTNECKVIKVINDTERKYCYKCQKNTNKDFIQERYRLIERV